MYDRINHVNIKIQLSAFFWFAAASRGGAVLGRDVWQTEGSGSVAIRAGMLAIATISVADVGGA
jgi:hypothetical protein